MLVRNVIPSVSKAYEEMIQVDTPPGMDLSAMKDCAGVDTAHINIVNAHFIVSLIWGSDSSSSTVVGTAWCAKLTSNERVISGAAILNLQ